MMDTLCQPTHRDACLLFSPFQPIKIKPLLVWSTLPAPHETRQEVTSQAELLQTFVEAVWSCHAKHHSASEMLL